LDPDTLVMGKVPAVPKVEASEAAIQLESSLSPQLSQLLANSGGALKFQLQSTGAAGQGLRAGHDSDRLVSYVRPVSATPESLRGSPRSRSGQVVKVDEHKQPAETSRGSNESDYSSSLHEEDLLPEPELDFDDEIIEYVLLPTKFERGVIWLDGVSKQHERMTWGPTALSALKVPMMTGAGGAGRSGSVASSVPLVEARVVDPNLPEVTLQEGRGPEARALRAGARGERGLAARAESEATPRERAARAARARQGGPGPPAMKEINHCWHGESRKSKWQLVQRAVEDPGEVSRLIDEVRRRSRGRSARHRRLGRSNVFAHPQMSLVHGF